MRIHWEHPLPKTTADALMGKHARGVLNGVRFIVRFRCPVGGWAATAYGAASGGVLATYDVWHVGSLSAVKAGIVDRIKMAVGSA